MIKASKKWFFFKESGIRITKTNSGTLVLSAIPQVFSHDRNHSDGWGWGGGGYSGLNSHPRTQPTVRKQGLSHILIGWTWPIGLLSRLLEQSDWTTILVAGTE